MLKVLTLSTLFPDASRPTFGGFVERQTRALSARADVELRVVAPVALPPFRWLHRHPNYRGLAELPLREDWKGLDVYRPRFWTLPRIGERTNPMAMRRALLPLLRAIRRDFAFDVIDAEFFYPDGPAAAGLARALGVPFSIKARGTDINFWGHHGPSAAQIRKAGLAADGLLAVSAALKREMVRLGLPEAKIKVHHTGVDQSAFRPVDRAAAKAALAITGPLLLSIGNLIPPKGHQLVIEAMTALAEASLLIVGRGPHYDTLQAQIDAAGLADRVRLTGPLPHEQIPPLLAAADALVLASQAEGLANVWVEALACGTPIVITDVGGAREVVDRPAAGRIVEATPDAITAGVRAILASPPVQADVAAAAARFTWERNSDALYAHLAHIVALHRL
jgi:teichuronic acid biosynthesis glycosyltransferase TuaC